MVKIRDKTTGKVMEVQESELGNYGITRQAPPQQQSVTPQSSSSGIPQYITGHSIEEHNQALQAARADNNKEAIKQISDDLQREYQFQKDTGAIGDPTKKNQDAEKAAKVKNDITSVAKQLQDVIKNRDKFEPAAYQDTVNSLASSIILKKKEADNLGAALSGGELAILSGQTPVTQQIGASFPQKVGAFFTGKQPVQRGQVVEDDQTLNRKLALLIAGLNGESVTPEMMAQANLPQQKKKTGGILNNAVEDIKGIGNSILSLPNQGIELAKRARAGDKEALRQIQDNANPGMVAFNGIKGLIGEANDLLGRPLEGGDIIGRAVDRAKQKPVTTALDILPFIKTPKVGGIPKNVAAKAGGKLAEDVRKIDVGPSVYGVSKETSINKTLDDLGIKGSAQQQYAQLEPTMSRISDKIDTKLSKESTQIPLDKITTDFNTNLSDQLRTKNLSATSAKKEIAGYIQDLYGKKLGSTIDSYELFNLKKKINHDYQGVARKKASNAPLTDREKVISAARQTVDDVLAEYHPEVKELTKQQSVLYDAVESLYKARSESGPGVSILGNRVSVPGKITQGVKSTFGEALKRIGGKGNELISPIPNALAEEAYNYAQAGRINNRK